MSRAAGIYAPAYIKILDYSGEIATLTLYGAVLTAANWAAKQQLWDDLIVSLVGGLVLGNVVEYSYGNTITLPRELPTSKLAQRERKLLLSLKDTVNGKKTTMSVPTVVATLLSFVPGAGDVVRLDVLPLSTAIADLVDFARSVDGNVQMVTEAHFVGRNS